MRGGAGLLVLLGFCGLSCTVKSREEKYTPRPPGTVTFSKHLAPIVFENCSGCHRPGQSGPFPLLTFSDAKKHGKEIADVTSKRYMPPWLPESQPGEFLHQRGLSMEQIGFIHQWFTDGMPEGATADLPPAPKWNEEWQLGKPDLVVKLEQPYTLPADGKDVYRNLVIPVPLNTRRYVQALELRPGSRSVHHVFIRVDRTRNSRRLDELDPEPGFDGMDAPKTAESPSGQYLSWQPGKQAIRSAPGLGWALEPGADLVLQCHLKPNGKREPVQPIVAFYFTDQAPTNTPVQIPLNSFTIDIPAGAKDSLVEDSYVLPVDADIIGVLPHAHYLGKRLEGSAVLPNGKTAWRFLVPDWDFNWQGDYQYAKPVPLPKGTTLRMRYTYDNSTNNFRNPNQPPKRVQYGVNTTDEMGELWIQLLPHTKEDSATLTRDYSHKALLDVIAFNEYRLRNNPREAKALSNIGAAEMGLGKVQNAFQHFQQALQLDPRLEDPHYYLGLIYRMQNKPAEAQAEFETTLSINPDHGKANGNLGLLMLDQKNITQAEKYFREALRVNPSDPIANDSLGVMQFNQGNWEEARRLLEAALRENPEDAEVQHHLQTVRKALGL
jgi:tetratricopeptide (TPR) repeat protein